jgi:hypothetical protein
LLLKGISRTTVCGSFVGRLQVCQIPCLRVVCGLKFLFQLNCNAPFEPANNPQTLPDSGLPNTANILSISSESSKLTVPTRDLEPILQVVISGFYPLDVTTWVVISHYFPLCCKFVPISPAHLLKMGLPKTLDIYINWAVTTDRTTLVSISARVFVMKCLW